MIQGEARQICDYEPRHADGVKALARKRLDEESAAQPDVTIDDDSHRIGALYAPPDNRFVVAEEDLAPVGMAGIRRISDADCELRDLYVNPGRRREGIASEMMAELLDFVRGRGYARILLEIRPTMESEAHIYARYGFRDLDASENPPRSGRFLAIQLR